MTVCNARNPRTGELDFSFNATTAEEITAVARVARTAQQDWAALPLEKRCAVLEQLAAAIEERRTTIIRALSIDTGRVFLSEREVNVAAGNIRRWASLAKQVLPEDMRTADTQSKLVETVRYQNQYVPYALVGVISPWNFPITLSLIDAIPALAAGCAVMIKPSEVTSRFAAPLLEAVASVPGLKNILNVVLGDGETGAALVDTVDMICFTGSVKTGRLVAQAAARNFIPASLELGGKDPAIVTASADIDKATDALLRGSVLNAGQVCLSIERIYVEAEIADQFIEALTKKAAALSFNYPDVSSGEIGPLIFHKQAAIIESHIADAVEKGATIHTGGLVERHGGGHWLRPTVLSQVDHSMAIMREESFGPLLPVMTFETTEQAIALANDTTYGLSASVIAGSVDEAKDIAQHINAGGISLMDCGLTSMTYEPEKTSFGLSGLGGSRMGAASIKRFLRTKAFIANHGVPSAIDAFGEAGATVTLETPAA